MFIVAQCPYCGEPLDLHVDESGGVEQHYVEDCSVCCRPVEIRVLFAGGDGERDDVRVSVRRLED